MTDQGEKDESKKKSTMDNRRKDSPNIGHDESSHKKPKARKKGKKNNPKDMIDQKTLGKTPFFTTGKIYLSLCNFRRMIDCHGSLRGIWEGDCEEYIQNVKREMTTMRHSVSFLQTILTKSFEHIVFQI